MESAHCPLSISCCIAGPPQAGCEACGLQALPQLCLEGFVFSFGFPVLLSWGDGSVQGTTHLPYKREAWSSEPTGQLGRRGATCNPCPPWAETGSRSKLAS